MDKIIYLIKMKFKNMHFFRQTLGATNRPVRIRPNLYQNFYFGQLVLKSDLQIKGIEDQKDSKNFANVIM